MNDDADHPVTEGLQTLEETLESERVASQKASRVLLGTTAVLIATMGVFSFVNYSHIRTEWSEDRIAASLAHEVEKLGPSAMDELMALGEELLPVYAEQSKEQLTRLGPEMQRVLSEQMDLCFLQLQHKLVASLECAQERIWEGTEEIVLDCYPEFRAPGERSRLSAAFSEITQTALADSGMSEFRSRFTKDVEELRREILSFDVPESGDSMEELQKTFVHLWLQILDEELMKS